MTDHESHESMEASVAAYLLGAADAEEVAAVRAHLPTCPSCQELAARLTRVVAAVPLAAEEVQPPERLREGILQAASAEGSRAPVSRPQPAPPPAARRPWWARLGGFDLSNAAMAGLAVAVVALAVWNAGLTREIESQAVASSILTGTGEMAGVQAKVVDLRSQGVTLVAFQSMPRLSAGKIYELWLILPAGKPAAVGVFAPELDGSKVVALARSLTPADTLAVTIEDGPLGVSAPTQTPQLAGPAA